jgi:TRAP-type C4-dicarboxylate transport system substrate-binding protein
MRSTAKWAAIVGAALIAPLLLIGGIYSGIFTPTQGAAEVSLRLHHFLPPVSSTHKNFLAPWAKQVMKASGGRISIEIIPSMGLGGKPPQLADQVADGSVEMIWTLPSYTPGRFPKTETFELPGVNANPVTTNAALMEFYDKHLQDEYKEMHVLLLHVHAGQAFHSINPIRTLADLKGMKIRTPGNTGTMWLEEAGAIPVQSPIPEIPQMLSKNVVDAVMIPFEVAPSYKVAELTKYTTTLNNDGRIHTSVFLLAMSKDAYSALPVDLKKVINDHSRNNITKFAGEVWTGSENPGIKIAKDRGNEAIEFPASDMPILEALNERVISLWTMVNKDRFDGAALVVDAKDLLEKHAR